MTWLWPSFLYLLILIPLLIVAYILILRASSAFCRALFEFSVGARCASAPIVVAATSAVCFFPRRVDRLDHRISVPGQHRQRTGWQGYDHSHD